MPALFLYPAAEQIKICSAAVFRFMKSCSRTCDAAVPRQIQRRPGVRDLVDEVVARHVVTGIEAVEIELHVLQLFGAVGIQRFFQLVAFAPGNFSRSCVS